MKKNYFIISHSFHCESFVRLEIFTVMKIHVVLLVMTPYGDVVGYKHFGRPCCLHLQHEDGSPKCWYPTTSLHGVITQKTATWAVNLGLFLY
jgi:hypothetical protein